MSGSVSRLSDFLASMIYWKRVWIFVTSSFVMLGGSAGWAKDPTLVSTPPPMAKTSVSAVYLNEPTEVTLSVGGRVVEPLTFLIRKQPSSGRLGDLKRTGKTSAVVVYTPDPGASVGEDSFTFAAKSPDSPVSAPARVWIRLVERPPVLEHVGEIDFGAVYLGDSVGRDLVLRNSGGGRATGVIKTPAPWFVEGSPDYAVPSGAEARVRLVFRPEEEATFRETIIIGKSAGEGLTVRGAGVAPIRWSEGGLIFGPSERANGRANFSLTNETDEARSARFDWPDFLQAPSEVALPARETVSVEVRMSDSVTSPAGRSVSLRSGNFTGSIPLVIHPRPARLMTAPESVLDLGTISGEVELHGKFTLKNIGESDAPLEITLPEGIQIVPDPRRIILEPGGSREFEIKVFPPKSGSLRSVIHVGSPGTEPNRLEVHATARDKPRNALPVEDMLNVPPLPANGPGSHPTARLPRVEFADLVFSKSTEIGLEWAIPSKDYVGFKIQRRVVSPGPNGEVAIDWIEWDGEKISLAGDLATARLTRLPSDKFWMIRIIGFDASGALGEPSPTFRVATARGQHLTISPLAGILIGLLIVAVLLRLAVRHRNARLAQENDRLARLEDE